MKRYPSQLDMRAVALLIAYDGRLPKDQLLALVRRHTVNPRYLTARGWLNSEGRKIARSCALYLRRLGLIAMEDDGEDVHYSAAVPLSELADWLADELERFEGRAGSD
ncbi:hypothetical protein [Micromonospora globbae]|uniref:hypothetical protein n=1 Tax=Micromonospora globbae TaxID=1894969 RepID=UPI0034239F72